ncbi:MAG: hypothetical protein VCD00_11480, partial [Candidatus Hydrogenedentota bacterium]
MRQTIVFLIILTLIAPFVHSQESISPRQESATGIRHSLLVTGSNKFTYLFNEDSEVIWKVRGASRDGYMLDNGNILITSAKHAREYKKGTTDIVWEYNLSDENQEMSTAIRLKNGNTMLTELGPNPRILEVSKKGKIKVEVPLQPETDNFHMQTRMARKLENGNYLVPHLFAFQVKEYTPKGEVVRSIPTDLEQFGGREIHNWPFTAIVLPNGNIHANLTHGNKIAEFDPTGKMVWFADNTQIDGDRFQDPCGAQRMPNGNIVIGAYAQKDPAKPRVFEITRDKEVVWEFFHP